jgi:ferritin-like metal-binding protein YciE
LPDLSAAEQKLVHYLTEAHANERRLETILGEHVAVIRASDYRKRLERHEKETRGHAQAVERRIKQLGGSVDSGFAARAPEALQTAQTVARRAVTLAQGGLDAVRGRSDHERAVNKARAEYAEEAGEIALYMALESLAEALADADTLKLARSIRRDEERMSDYLSNLIPQLVRNSVEEEIAAPRPEARTSPRKRAPSTTRSSPASAIKGNAAAGRKDGAKSAQQRTTSSNKATQTGGKGRGRTSSRTRSK